LDIVLRPALLSSHRLVPMRLKNYAKNTVILQTFRGYPRPSFTLRPEKHYNYLKYIVFSFVVVTEQHALSAACCSAYEN